MVADSLLDVPVQVDVELLQSSHKGLCGQTSGVCLGGGKVNIERELVEPEEVDDFLEGEAVLGDELGAEEVLCVEFVVVAVGQHVLARWLLPCVLSHTH